MGACKAFSGGDRVGLDHCDVFESQASEKAPQTGLSQTDPPCLLTDLFENVPPVLSNDLFSISPRALWTGAVISSLGRAIDHPGVCGPRNENGGGDGVDWIVLCCHPGVWKTSCCSGISRVQVPPLPSSLRSGIPSSGPRRRGSGSSPGAPSPP